MSRGRKAASFWFGFGLAFRILNLSAFADGEGTEKLPPPAGVQIDFARDIKPIFENSCFQCHSPTKPRSHFRLDNRESALAGGDDGVDILPGKSAESPLIRYVAGLDKDIQMPPEGKGAPLTTNQIALLRAWIDQGAAWEAVEPPPTSTTSLSPFVSYTSVSGDVAKYREHYWQPEGANGGLEQFELWQRTGPDSTLTISGHVMRDDFDLKLESEKTDLGFVHAGWRQYRKYYDDTGGYDPLLSPSVTSLDRDLHLDLGRAWIDFGLTLPDWPRLVFGYEYQYRQGDEATLSWGNVDPNGRGISPAADTVLEHTHILKFDLDHEIAGTRIEDSFRAEFYHLNLSRTNQFYSDVFGAPNNNTSTQGYDYFQGANTLRLERKFNDWLFGSAGYLYSKLDADASASGGTTDLTGLGLDNNWQSQGITLDRESNVGNLNALLGPWNGLALSGGVQAELSREEGVGNLNQVATFQGTPVITSPVQQITSLNTSLLEESVSARYTKIPFTALFAEARLRQERIGQSELQTNDASQFFDPSFALDSRATTAMYDWRAGFNSSPWTWASFGAHYRRYDDDSHYDVLHDEQPIGSPGVGYPGFIHARDVLTDEVEARLVLRPVVWFKTTLSYKLLNTDYRTDTYPAVTTFVISPGGTIPAGESDIHIYSINATFTPWQRLYFSSTFSFQRSSTITADNGSPSVEPYRGDTYTALNSATWVLNQATDLLLTYSFSKADFSQDNFASGLPLGIRYQQHAVQAGFTRRLSKTVVARFQYAFNYYDEPSSGGANNYRANSILAMLTYRLP